MDSNVVGSIVGVLLVVAVILVVIFLVFREFFCWYCKINERIALLTEIRNLLPAKPLVSKSILPPAHSSPRNQTSPGQASSNQASPFQSPPESSPEQKCAALLHKLGYQLIEEDRLDDGKPYKKWTIASPTGAKEYVFSIGDLDKRVKMIAKKQGVIFD